MVNEEDRGREGGVGGRKDGVEREEGERTGASEEENAMDIKLIKCNVAAGKHKE